MSDRPAYVSFSADINPATTQSLLELCARLANEGTRHVTLLLSTAGGSVQQGIMAYNVLRGMPFELTTHNVGAVNSIGNVVFLAGEKRYAVPNSTFMFHGVGIKVPQSTRFEEKNLREKLNTVLADQKKIGAIIADRTKLNANKVRQLFRQAVTKDAAYAKSNGFVLGIQDVEIPDGAPIHQLVFK